MNVTVLADESVFEAAITAAGQIGRPGVMLRGLNAPLDSAIQGRVEEAWESIRSALDSAFKFGAEKANPLLEKAKVMIDEVIAGAGNRAAQVITVLRERLREYLARFVDEGLKLVRPKIRVGDETLHLTEIQVSHKIVLTGSLKASLTEAFSLTTNGELEIAASYTTDKAE